MKRINLLNEETSNKIAAGEVVERPSSVVKELIENSIDAEAKNITVEILNGGKDKIKIIDDGHGIHPDDIEKAFLPHGTSKISYIDDIYKINTFGFRGEALPSIAAVSSVILKSRSKDKEFGKEISIDGGKINYINDTGCNIGTSIDVNNIFYNVPARHKFLKSTQREAALISNIINRLALANHNISFKYYNNDKKTLITFASNDVKDTIRSVYGKQIYDNIIGFEKHSDIASVHGYIGNSEISRGSRNNQSIFVNRRYIKSGLITTAVENAFKSFLTVNKYPFFVLFLDIYPEFIDVNVHPTKSEIKFEDERSIYKLVFNTVHESIAESVKKNFNLETNHSDILENDMKFSGQQDEKVTPIQLPIDLKQDNIKESSKVEDKLFDYEKLNNINLKTNTNKKEECICENKSRDSYFSEQDVRYDLKKTNESFKEETNKKHSSDEAAKEAKFPSLKIIGQFNNTYIIGEEFGEFYMIDQHAAHEKILFEKYRKQIETNEVVSQILIVPVVLELSHEDFSHYIENKKLFIETGFDIELFGDNTLSLREAPLLLGKTDVRTFFLEILDNIKNMGSGKTAEVKHKTIASLSCKAAIKANHSLSQAEMITLIETLRYIDEPFNCPHGRPTIIKMSLKEIEKKFKRIQ